MGWIRLIKRAYESCRLARVDANTLGPMYRSMHQSNCFPGTTWKRNLDDFRAAVPNLARQIILDFGCGPNGGVLECYPQAIAYDPYVKKYERDPWRQPIDVVHSSDVLEHMPRAEIRQLCHNIQRSTATCAFLVISTRAALKRLPNGMNAHVTVKSPEWWIGFLSKHLGGGFRLKVAKADFVSRQVVVCFERMRIPTGDEDKIRTLVQKVQLAA